MLDPRWKPAKDGDSLNEYNLQCEEKEETVEKEVVKISESVQPFDTDKHVQLFDSENIKPFDTEAHVQPFDTEKLAEERVLVEQNEEEDEEENVEEEKVEEVDGGRDNLGLED